MSIDALVAERVMGWPISDDPRCKPPTMLREPNGSIWHAGGVVLFSPSTDMNHAMMVVDNVLDGRAVRFSLMYGAHMKPRAEFFDIITGSTRYVGCCETTTLAICLAALRAKGVSDKEIEEVANG